jgi:hypothetical protein
MHCDVLATRINQVELVFGRMGEQKTEADQLSNGTRTATSTLEEWGNRRRRQISRQHMNSNQQQGPCYNGLGVGFTRSQQVSNEKRPLTTETALV